MSGTDVHSPGWVKERDPGWAPVFAPFHDHGSGPCDWELWRRDPLADTRCGNRYTGHVNIYCGCAGCTGCADRRLHHRQARAGWRQARRELLGLVRAGQPAQVRRELPGCPHRGGAWISWRVCGRARVPMAVSAQVRLGRAARDLMAAVRERRGAGVAVDAVGLDWCQLGWDIADADSWRCADAVDAVFGADGVRPGVMDMGWVRYGFAMRRAGQPRPENSH